MSPHNDPAIDPGRKARGAFFTPPALCEFVTSWAVTSGADLVLEPSCGDAEFLLAAARRLDSLGPGSGAVHLHGVEVHSESAVAASERLGAAGFAATLTVSDFFEYEAPHQFDAVIGNPPYVRFQEFTGAARARSRASAASAAVHLSGLASSWASFVVRSTELLAPGGRLGLVLPGELLTVNYAAPVRRHLLESFGRVRLVLFEERVFPQVTEEVVLLLAEGRGDGPTDHIELHEARNVASLRPADRIDWTATAIGGKRWSGALIGADTLGLYSEATEASHWTTLSEWGDPNLGMVTGNNKWFTLDDKRKRELGFRLGRDVVKISPPGSKHLRGPALSEAAWEDLRQVGAPVWLFRPVGVPSEAARAYIDDGEDAKVNEAYKCRVRADWWRVPLVEPPDLILTYMNHEAPRLIWNGAGVRCLNSVHGFRLAGGADPGVGELLPIAALNSLTLLGAELVGRSYGGGILKLEPREAELLPVPAPSDVAANRVELREISGSISGPLRGEALWDTVERVDEVLLAHLDGATVDRLRSGRAGLARRRAARGKG